MLAAGSLVVLGLVIGLAQLTRGTSRQLPAPPAVPPPAPPAAAPSAEVTPSVVAQSAAREKPALASATRAPIATSAKTPQLTSPPVSFARDLKRDDNGNLVPIIPVKELRELLPLADAPMKACIEKSGQHATGKATLNFTVAAKNNKLLVDTTGVQDDETLAGYPEMLECMHRTATLLLPDGRPVPELGTPIYVRRHVRVENGQLVEDSLFNFSYHP